MNNDGIVYSVGTVNNAGTLISSATGIIYNGVCAASEEGCVVGGALNNNTDGTLTFQLGTIFDNTYGTLNNNAGGRIESYVDNFYFNELAVGTVNLDSGSTFVNYAVMTSSSVLTNVATIENNGTLASTATGTINNGGTLDNSATLENDGTLTNDLGALLTNSCMLDNIDTLDNTGTLNNKAGSWLNNYSEMNNDGTLNNTGLLSNNSGGTLNNTGTITSTGTIENEFGATMTLTEGVVDASLIYNAGTFNPNGGILNVDTFNGDLNNTGGTVCPGHSPGITTINGDYSQDANSMLLIEILGMTSGTEYDVLNVTGSATLGGVLNIDLDYAGLALGDSFDILIADAILGEFASVSNGSINERWIWTLDYDLDGSNTVTASVSAVPLPAAAWLFMSAIAGLAGAKRLSRSKGSA